MALQTPNDFNMTPCACHICHGEITEDQYAVEHSGHGQMTQSKDPRFSQMFDLVQGYTTIWLHPECATVLMLRLANDVMRVKHEDKTTRRVVDVLQDVARVNQVKKGV